MAALISSLRNGHRKLAVALALPGLLALSSCGSGDSAQAATEQQMQPQAVSVEAIPLQPVSVESVRTLPGRATAFAQAEIRPQVTGLIEKRLFTEGQQVEEGDALYQIDRSEYISAVESARASLAALATPCLGGSSCTAVRCFCLGPEDSESLEHRVGLRAVSEPDKHPNTRCRSRRLRARSRSRSRSRRGGLAR